MINPTERTCFVLCPSCFRCANKGCQSLCNVCSGRHDPLLRHDPYDIDDYCRCREGVLQYRVKAGRLIVRRFPANPFRNKLQFDVLSQDERDWESYVDDLRERLDDEDYDPVRFDNGPSTLNWMRKARG